MNTRHGDNQSEVARLRAQIAQEYEAAQAALTALASGTARHAFITARMDRIGVHQEALASLVGEQESMAIVCSIFEGDVLPERLSPPRE